ncbi:DUF2535 family protein [Metabacillus indicus]|uniref:DUF2535 family protein n=1 Tax=Metabacillus indicus TaxID=246786 RepID=UPI00049335BF|nr:DUF2535 family protein [Metabacillus indicus]KEZ50603.1 hypothetical protein AZ46_0208040 [Metabacillus indicus LMG 22858]
MLFKSLEFKLLNGHKVKITDIPVLEEDNQYRFLVQSRLQSFLRKITAKPQPNAVYSFKEYLKRTVKWTDYEAIYQPVTLKHNA